MQPARPAITQPAPTTRDLTWGFLWGAIAPLVLALIVTGVVLSQAFTVIVPAPTVEAGYRYRGQVGLGMWGKVPSPGDQLRVYLPPDRIPELVPVDGRTEARGTLAILPFFWLLAVVWLFVASALHWGLAKSGQK